jgi:hypothetical protein
MQKDDKYFHIIAFILNQKPCSCEHRLEKQT